MKTPPAWLFHQPIAHRGLHNSLRGENSREALLASIEANFPVELDVQMTHDGHLVVTHDRNLRRITGHSVHVPSASLKKVQAYPAKKSNLPLPTLEEFLSLTAGRVPLMIEVKPAKLRHRERAEAVAMALQGYHGEAVVESFDPHIVDCLQTLTPRAVGLVVGRYRDAETSKKLRRALEHHWLSQARKLPLPDFISHDIRFLTPAISRRIREHHRLPLVTWTIKNENHETKAIELADSYCFEGFTPAS